MMSPFKGTVRRTRGSKREERKTSFAPDNNRDCEKNRFGNRAKMKTTKKTRSLSMMLYLTMRIISLYILTCFCIIFLLACQSEQQKTIEENRAESEIVVDMKSDPVFDYDTTKWTEIVSEDGYIIDIKYATTDNFVKEIIYPCGRFFLRPEVANALEKVSVLLKEKGFKLILFDGYRPKPAQQKLWDKVPDSNYVAPPSEGSMHNRGVAVDLSLTDMDGNELDMGTPYDFFGPKGHHDYTDLPKSILDLRKTLKSVMEANGFQSIRTEWWHYSYKGAPYPLDDWQWPCLN